MTDLLRPRSHITRLVGGVTVLCIGIDRDTNWAFDRTKEGWYNDIVKEALHTFPFATRLFVLLTVEMNGKIAPASAFKQEPFCEELSLMTGAFADGVMLGKGDLAVSTSADCQQVTLVFADGRVLTFHAGLECFLQTGNNSNGPFKVQGHNVLENALRSYGKRPGLRQVHISCGIRSRYSFPLSHKVYGAANLAMRTWCEVKYPNRPVFNLQLEELNMYELIKAELMRLGVLEALITMDDIDTSSDVDEVGKYRWASNARQAADGSTKLKQRNLVIVARE
ncbi:hypothetical protein COB52_01685 [Candidatus Kaiserbacteria bacterium]|nr:MAG: hypothetical protein COB52_01685 [Candidatus Kaiserbacteria bacterium]